MTKQELETKLTKNLKDFIKKRKHYETGKLYNSIKVDVKDTGDNVMLSFNAMEYIKYLDDGDFMRDFMKLDSTKKAINEYIGTKIQLALRG